MMKRVQIMNRIGLALLASTTLATWPSTAIAAEPKEAKREMLSKHETVAQFNGVAYQQCLGRTSLCPDKCGQSGDFASFRILKYIAYSKPGQYGDPKQTQYRFQVEDNMKNVKVTLPIKEAVAALKKGDYVLLDWQHDYVTRGGASFPERVVQKLQTISRDEADKLTGGLDQLPPPPKEGPVIQPRGGIMPVPAPR